MEVLQFLQRIRIPVLNEFMLLITEFGGELAFLATAIIIFWCVDKRQGYYIMCVGFAGTIISQFMKLWFRIPRPWVSEPDIAMEAAVGDAGGYSFPSGHSQTSVGTFGGLALTTKNKLIRYICVAIAVLVPFSRMYVGVHTPLDVGVGALISLVLIFAVRPIVYSDKKYAMPILIGFLAALTIAYLFFVFTFAFPADVDAYNLTHGRENACTMAGCILGMIVVYFIDKKWLQFPTKAVWWAQIVKVAVGLGLVLAVKSGMKGILNHIFGDMAGRAVRYFLIVLVAGILWPMTFRFFERIGNSNK